MTYEADILKLPEHLLAGLFFFHFAEFDIESSGQITPIDCLFDIWISWIAVSWTYMPM